MPDVFTKSKRSEVMSRIRSRGNKDTEIALARLFRVHGIKGWRRHVQLRIDDCGSRNSTSPQSSPQRGGGEFRTPRAAFRVSKVRPDFVFRKERVAVFVDGCFWHGCPKHATWPANRAAWWRAKIEGNRSRDRRVNRALRRAGWRVVRVWEHQLKRGTRSGERGTTAQPRSGGVSRVVTNAATGAVIGRIRRALGLGIAE